MIMLINFDQKSCNIQLYFVFALRYTIFFWANLAYKLKHTVTGVVTCNKINNYLFLYIIFDLNNAFEIAQELVGYAVVNDMPV